MVVVSRFRVCAVCGRRHGVTYAFRNTLLRIGIATPYDRLDKAVPSCVISAVKKYERQQSRQGRKTSCRDLRES
jgi:hypothetical protein